MGSLGGPAHPGLLNPIQTHLQRNYMPALHAFEAWGELETTPQGKATKKNFLANFDNFTQFLHGELILILLF